MSWREMIDCICFTGDFKIAEENNQNNVLSICLSDEFDVFDFSLLWKQQISLV